MFLVGAVYSKRFPARKINMNYGYRTRRSMKNQELWNYAQVQYNKNLLKGGVVMILLGLLMWLLGSSQPVIVIVGMAGMFLVIVAVVVSVEKKLKRFELHSESSSIQ